MLINKTQTESLNRYFAGKAWRWVCLTGGGYHMIVCGDVTVYVKFNTAGGIHDIQVD